MGEHDGHGEYVLLQTPEKGIGLGWVNDAGHSVIVSDQMQILTQFGKASLAVDPLSNTIQVTFGGAQQTKITADVGRHYLDFYQLLDRDAEDALDNVLEDVPGYATDLN